MVPTVNGFGKGVDVTDKTRQTVPYAQVVATMQYMQFMTQSKAPSSNFKMVTPSSRNCLQDQNRALQTSVRIDDLTIRKMEQFSFPCLYSQPSGTLSFIF